MSYFYGTRTKLCSHSWYHFLSLYLSISPWAVDEKFSASDIMRAVRSSRCDNFSPRSTTIWCAMFTSPVALETRSRRASFGPGMCFATVRDARPLDSPTATDEFKVSADSLRFLNLGFYRTMFLFCNSIETYLRTQLFPIEAPRTTTEQTFEETLLRRFWHIVTSK